MTPSLLPLPSAFAPHATECSRWRLARTVASSGRLPVRRGRLGSALSEPGARRRANLLEQHRGSSHRRHDGTEDELAARKDEGRGRGTSHRDFESSDSEAAGASDPPLEQASRAEQRVCLLRTVVGALGGHHRTLTLTLTMEKWIRKCCGTMGNSGHTRGTGRPGANCAILRDATVQLARCCELCDRAQLPPKCR